MGATYTVTVTITNNEAKPVRGVGASILIGDGAHVRIDAPGGKVDRLCDAHHDPNAKAPCRDMGVEYRGRTIAPGDAMRLVARVTVSDFQCPGGGDFMHEVLATTFGPVKHGPNGGRHYVWYENDEPDYAAKNKRTMRPDGCYSESITD